MLVNRCFFEGYDKMQFDFGKNWKEFSEKALSQEKVEQARSDFRALMGDINVRDATFLDIGFGQGLTLLIAAEMGAKSVGCEINPISSQVLDFNRERFFPLGNAAIPVVIGSVLDPKVIGDLKQIDFLSGKSYDIVHSWGVLHHTGKMWDAIRVSSGLVRPGGHLIISIYNRHWTNGIWRMIKWFYNKSPKIIQKLLVYSSVPVIYVAKFLVTGKNPTKSKRGMDFYFDIIDWLGGYPYEYATKNEVIGFVQKRGFKCLRCVPANVPTGCNEFIFQKEHST